MSVSRLDGLGTSFPMGNNLFLSCVIYGYVYGNRAYASLIFSRYFPFGVNGVFAGSATLFYSYVGFDSVTSTAEEVYFE